MDKYINRQGRQQFEVGEEKCNLRVQDPRGIERKAAKEEREEQGSGFEVAAVEAQRTALERSAVKKELSIELQLGRWSVSRLNYNLD